MSSHSRPVIRTESTGDLVNVLPVLVGFRPENSLVLVSTRGSRMRFGPVARVDLPDPEHVEDLGAYAGLVVRRFGGDGVVALAVGDDPVLMGEVIAAVERHVPRRPAVFAWATDSHTWTLDGREVGEPYDRDPQHPAVVASMLEGQEILPDRAALVAKFAPVAGERRRWLDAAYDEIVIGAGVEEILSGAVRGDRLDDGDALRLVRWANTPDAFAGLLRRACQRDGAAWSRVWLHVARSAPAGERAAPFCVSGVAAYAQGNGAHAREAFTAALVDHPAHAVACLLLEALESAMPPEALRRLVAA